MAAANARAWVNGRVFTGRRFVEAALAVDGRIEAVGPATSVRRVAPTGAEVVDLEGDWLLPGLIDAHCHLAPAIVARDAPDLADATSFDEIRDRIVAVAASGASSSPIVARGWDEGGLVEAAYPTRAVLDRWPVDAPLVLLRRCHHVAVVNSRTLELLGWSDATPDPVGGRLGRESGRLDGVLYEAAVGALRPVFASALARSLSAVGPFLSSLNALGLTTIAPMGVAREEIAAVLDAVAHRPLVRLRPYVGIEAVSDATPPTHARPGLVRTAGAKLYLDGSLGARTAWLRAPYADAQDELGFATLQGGALDAALATAHEAGLPVALHAIGDRAIAEALRALDRAPTVGVPRIEHASVTPPAILRELARLRPVLVVQPHFAVSDTWLGDRVGPERARWTYAWASLRGAGVTLAGSSDAPIEPFDPWSGIRAAVAPRRWGPSERLDPVAAFGLYSSGGAAALGEPELGSLEVGARADAVRVAGSDWTTVVASGASGVITTFLEGAPVFERSRRAAAAAERG